MISRTERSRPHGGGHDIADATHGLIEVGLDLSTGTQTAASAAGSPVVETVLGAGLGAGRAVDELVIVHADVGGFADEDAGFHVADAGGAHDPHGSALHVGLAADVDDAHLAERVLAPGVGDLAVQHDGVVVDGGPGARLARREADGRAGAVGDRGGHQRLLDVDPGSLGAPDDEDQVLAGFVAELAGVGSIGAEPDTALGGALGVEADGAEAEIGQELGGVARG